MSLIEGIAPCRLWSLWDMAANFEVHGLNFLISQLNVLIGTSYENMNYFGSLNNHEKEMLNSNKKYLDECRLAIDTITFCARMSVHIMSGAANPHIAAAAKKMNNTPTAPLIWSEVNTRSRALRDAIEVELETLLFFQYPKVKGEKYLKWKSEWQLTVAAFPKTQPEILSATDCYALGQNTASVFHSMRVAEIGLRALAKERKIKLAKNKPVEWGTWQDIIKALDEEIKIIGTTKQAGAAKDKALEFYSGARADLNGFKDEFRNQVMHVRDSYDELQALRALTKVNAFMERLSNKIDEKHHRIKWGLR